MHQVELRHSIVSGKWEVLFDNDLIYNNKQMFQGTFEFRNKLKGHDVHVTVEDTFEGYLYDLIVDGIAFHRMPRKTMGDIERLRAEKSSEPTVSTDFASFTGKGSSTLDGKKPKKPAAKPRDDSDEDEVDLLGASEWGAKPQAQQATFNPFDEPQQQQQPHYQQPSYAQPFPYAQPPAAAAYGAPQYAQPAPPPPAYSSPYPDPFSAPAPAQYAPQQPYYPPHDPFAQPPPPPPQPQPQPQPYWQQPPPQQKPYDPFA